MNAPPPSSSPRGCSVDAELFDCLEDAIAFVAERGGGIVYTDLVESLLAQIILMPPGVSLAPPRHGRPQPLDEQQHGPSRQGWLLP